ncbi:glutathione S-transferase [Chytriomyces cf. hyalinus JEL632]|nr:glutathione S-transferase [Chytriomyces cf. hyalinus JEL632]
MSKQAATLFYTATSCGAASFISAHRAGLLGTVLNAPIAGSDFLAVNSKGNVPTIVLPDGTVLNENVATLQWVADQAGGIVHHISTLYPDAKHVSRYLLATKLSWVSSEMHAICAPLFNSSLSPEVRGYVLGAYNKKLQYLNQVELEGKSYLVGNDFSVADACAYIVLSSLISASTPMSSSMWIKSPG